MSTPQAFDPTQPISSVNPAPQISIVRLSALGVPAGVTYALAVYSHPGVSALVASGQMALMPGNPDTVPASAIVRAS